MEILISTNFLTVSLCFGTKRTHRSLMSHNIKTNTDVSLRCLQYAEGDRHQNNIRITPITHNIQTTINSKKEDRQICKQEPLIKANLYIYIYMSVCSLTMREYSPSISVQPSRSPSQFILYNRKKIQKSDS